MQCFTSTVYVYFVYHDLFYGVHNSFDINAVIVCRFLLLQRIREWLMARESKKKVIDRLYLTYSSEFAGKKFAYDGERSLYTVGPLPQNNFEFTVVVEELLARRHVLCPMFMFSLVLV